MSLRHLADKMNIILVFCACGLMLIVMLVICTVVLVRSRQREYNSSSLPSDKQVVYQPYVADTMVMVSKR